MEFTGERYIPELDSAEISYEHWHRYLYAAQYVKGKMVLDIACGEGYGANLLAKTAKKVVGVDIDGKTIGHAKKTYQRDNLEFLEGSVEAIPVNGEGVFDVIISFETIEHVDEAAQKRFMGEVRRLLKPDGVFICSTPNKQLYSDLHRYENEFHLKEFYYEDYKDFLIGYFKNIEVLGQKVYSSSHIWPADGMLNKFVEFDLKFESGTTVPTNDGKQMLYFLAICSNVELPVMKRSVLNDLSDRILSEKDSRILKLQDEVEELSTWGKSLDEQIAEKGQRIVDLQNEVEEKNRWVETLKSDLGVEETRVSVLKGEIGVEEEALGKLQEALREKEESMLRLQEAFKEKDDLMTQLQEALKEKEESMLQLHEAFKEKDDLMMRLHNDVRARDVMITDLSSSFSYVLGRAITFPLRILIPHGSRREIVYAVLRNILRHPVKSFKKIRFRDIKRFLKVLRSEPADLIINNTRNYLGIGGEVQGKVVEQFFEDFLPDGPVKFKKSDVPLVSIVIPVFNQWEFTQRCLFSVAKNSGDLPYEVIVADDRSTDQTKEISKFVRNVVVVKNSGKSGFLNNCNNAAKSARGKYLLFLNNDTYVKENWLKPLVDALEKDETVGIVGSKLIFPNGQLQEAGGIIWRDGTGWNYGRFDDPFKSEYNYLKEVDYVSGASLMIRKDLWDKIGGFDEKFSPAYFEDTDLAFAARKSGYKVFYQPKSEVIHFEGISNGRDEQKGIKRYQARNRKKFVKKWEDVLMSDHFEPVESVFLARDRSRGKKIILVVDYAVPAYDRHAGGRMVFQYMKFFLKMGYAVKFLPDNFYKYGEYGEKLEQMGIEVFYGPDAMKGFDKFLSENGKYIDFVFMNRAHISVKFIDKIKQNSDAKIIYNPADLSYLREEREHRVTGREDLRNQARNSRKNEFRMFERSDVIVTVSEHEKALIQKELPDKEVCTVPVYLYDQKFFDAHEVAPFEKRNGILFVGGFLHSPNMDAVLWFVREVFPKILERDPSVVFNIVGGNAPKEVLALASKNVRVWGYVSDENLKELYQSVRVVAVPLRYGAGVKGKVIEAMAEGVPVVTTEIGAEGILGLGDYDCLSIVKSEQMADTLFDVYSDSEIWNKLSLNSRKVVEKYYTEDFLTETLQKIVFSKEHA